MAKKQTKTIQPTSIAAVLRKVKLPPVVFHVNLSYRITRLANLRFEDAKSGTCECDVVCGSEEVRDSGIVHLNEHKVPMKACYPTIRAALEAVEYDKRLCLRREFKRKYDGYNRSQSEKIRLLKQYPELVLSRLKAEFELEEDSPITAEALNLTHYRKAVGYFAEILEEIIGIKFPDLAATDNEYELED